MCGAGCEPSTSQRSQEVRLSTLRRGATSFLIVTSIDGSFGVCICVVPSDGGSIKSIEGNLTLLQWSKPRSPANSVEV